MREVCSAGLPFVDPPRDEIKTASGLSGVLSLGRGQTAAGGLAIGAGRSPSQTITGRAPRPDVMPKINDEPAALLLENAACSR